MLANDLLPAQNPSALSFFIAFCYPALSVDVSQVVIQRRTLLLLLLVIVREVALLRFGQRRCLSIHIEPDGILQPEAVDKCLKGRGTDKSVGKNRFAPFIGEITGVFRTSKLV